jgi:hypothetical protein
MTITRVHSMAVAAEDREPERRRTLRFLFKTSGGGSYVNSP